MSDIRTTPSAQSISRGVRLFLERLLEDPLLAWTFVGVDQDQLHRHALAFVVAALGGPDQYLGRNLRDVHERFELTDKHFDVAMDYLIDSLREAGVTEGVLAELAIRVEPLRRQIVSR